MRINPCTLAVGLFLSGSLLVTTPADAFAQGKKNSGSVLSTVSIALSKDVTVQIQQFYSLRAASGAEALPPGIRKRLARGKELPPGIAKQVVPTGLRSRIELPAGFEIVEVGLDILLVEIATDIVHDVLMDVVR
jgi:hypothetical protein